MSTRRVRLVASLVAVALLVAAGRAEEPAPPAPSGVTVHASEGPLAALLSVSTARTTPGAAVDLRLAAEPPTEAGLDLDWPDVRAALTAALGEDVVEVESVRVAPDRRSLDARLRLYDEGDHDLPPLTVRARRGAGEPTDVVLQGITLHVDVDVPLDADPAPARDALPLEVPPRPFPWLATAAGAVVLAALLAALVAWRRRTRTQPPPPPPAPPHERALAALRSLAQRALPERGEVEPYFVALSEILRTYLEERFALRAPEQTTEEFLATVSQTEAGRRAIESAHRDLLREFLTRADLVKFARDRPAPDECGAAGSSAERFVRETAPAAAPAEDAS